MGDIHAKETHVIRSSSMSFALRWKRENLKIISPVAIISLIMTFMFLVMLHTAATRSVTLIINGKETVIKTRQLVLQRLLDEQAISVGEYDRISVPLTSVIKDGDRIVIDKAVPVQITADGKTQTQYTTKRTVSSVLEDLNIPVGEEDKVTPSLDAQISENTEIRIVRVNKVLEEITESVPYDTVRKNDPKLVKGKELVIQEGEEGVLAKKIEKVYEDGQLVSETVVDESVQKESVDKIVAVGTKNPVTVLSASSPNIDQVTKGGVTFGFKQILNNVTVTAYSAGPSSTGKTPDHPQYAMTSSGTRATEGRTIAVDPKVIPIGWWVYIEGIGFRRAEDTGSGVKGPMIDIYFENQEYAKKFGLKRGYKVYIIGKEKPVID